uniref:Uncharacterized protein n=1 Tax=Physcomitrium patens TaxID=3218 RepID=A0A2K1KI73_PHYPA|nr:hypothetical protein PHYPA_007150 [Physcomitrium patens]
MARPGEYYDRRPGPSPWIPATILGIIFLIASSSYRSALSPAVAYPPTRNPAAFIPPVLIWVPILLFLAAQFFGGTNRPHGYDHLGRPLMRAGSYGGGGMGEYGDGLMYGDGPYNRYRQRGPYAKRDFMSSVMDYGGHWLLIFLGLWLFSLFGPRSASMQPIVVPML